MGSFPDLTGKIAMSAAGFLTAATNAKLLPSALTKRTRLGRDQPLIPQDQWLFGVILDYFIDKIILFLS